MTDDTRDNRDTLPTTSPPDAAPSAVQRAFSGAPWEASVGYCRAIRVGQQVFVSGTAPVGDDGATVGVGDAYAQASRCWDIVERALAELGAEMSHVVRTRMYVTDVRLWAEFGRAHHDRFAGYPPATTMVEVRALIGADMLIEVEAEAVVP